MAELMAQPLLAGPGGEVRHARGEGDLISHGDRLGAGPTNRGAFIEFNGGQVPERVLHPGLHGGVQVDWPALLGGAGPGSTGHQGAKIRPRRRGALGLVLPV